MQQQYITKELLEEVGIVLPEQPVDEETAFITHLNNALAERIGNEITSSLDDVKLNEMLEIEESGDAAKLQEWLHANVPELGEIVQDEVDILLGEIAENANTVMQVSAKEPVNDEANLEAVETDLVNAATREAN